MKNFKSYIRTGVLASAALAMGMSLTSCDDMLDTKPMGQFTAGQLTENEATDLLVSAYASLLNHFPNINGVDYGNNQAFAGPINNWVMDLRSDDAVKGGDGVTMEEYMTQLEVANIQNDNASITFKWLNNYTAIARCNAAIKALLGAGSLDPAARESMVAEMKTLRAYFYFDMYRLFKKFPYITEENSDPSQVSPNEFTKAEILSFIEKDLADAYNILPASQPAPGRFNKFVAAALLAKVALFDSDWATVEKYTSYVIGSGKYDLYPNFLDISKPEMNNTYESVMAIQFSMAQSPEQFNFNNCLNCTWSEGNLYGNGDDFYLATQDLVNAFRTDEHGLPYLDGSQNSKPITSADYDGNVDPRLDFTLGRIGMPWRGYQYNDKWCRNLELYGQYSGKKPYPSPDSEWVQVGIVPWGANSLNYIIIRYADVLLMRAEALIELNAGGLDEARNIINRIRKRAIDSVDASYTPVDCDPTVALYNAGQYPASGWSQDYARKALRHERRVELAMEGHRWFDLVRWGTAVETVNKFYQYEVQYQPYYNGANLSEDELYFPIPLSEVDKAHGLYD